MFLFRNIRSDKFPLFAFTTNFPRFSLAGKHDGAEILPVSASGCLHRGRKAGPPPAAALSAGGHPSDAPTSHSAATTARQVRLAGVESTPTSTLGWRTGWRPRHGHGHCVCLSAARKRDRSGSGPRIGRRTGGGGAGLQSALLVDIATRPASGYADADGISDDDRMSLENSVFDESLTSTPVKVAGYLAGRYAGMSHMAKRAQRSSSSTVDSAYGSSLGGHSERFASSSTSVDFRSRFSSVDTQSSLDEKPLSSSIDSPLARDPRDAYRERAVLNDAMHKLNNNNTSLGLALYSASNNNNGSSVASDGSKLPVVPARKQPPPVKGSSNSSNSIGETQSQSSKEPSSVSASASTSSAASAGSSTISSGTMSSMSGPCPAVVPPTDAITKRPGPPEPPLRQANVFDPVETGSRGHPPPPLTVRNKLGRNKPPPITYPRMQQRQDSTLSSDSYSISSSPGYNSKLMEAPLLGSQQGDVSLMHPAAHSARLRSWTWPPPAFWAAPAEEPEAESRVLQCRHRGARSTSGRTRPSPATALARRPVRDTILSSWRRRCCPRCPPSGCAVVSTSPFHTRALSLLYSYVLSAPAPIVCRQGVQHEPIEELEPPQTISPLHKAAGQPSSLQTIVRFQNGAPHTMSLQHQV